MIRYRLPIMTRAERIPAGRAAHLYPFFDKLYWRMSEVDSIIEKEDANDQTTRWAGRHRSAATAGC
jgi:hypothetical protein